MATESKEYGGPCNDEINYINIIKSQHFCKSTMKTYNLINKFEYSGKSSKGYRGSINKEHVNQHSMKTVGKGRIDFKRP